MAVGDPQEVEFMKQLMKAYKFEWEHASNQAAKDQAASKADTLRQNAKDMGIDLSQYGQGRLLKDTPGGNNINWNVLSTVGKAWAGLNPTDDVSKWKQSVGTGLVSNLSGYQADFASFADSAAYDMKIGGKMTIPKPAAVGTAPIAGVPPVISGSNVGAPVTPPTVVTPPVVPPASVTPNRTTEGLGQMQASQATALQAARPVKPVEAPDTGMEWTQPMGLNGAWEQTPIKTQGVVDAEYDLTTNEGMLAAFLADNPDVKETDNTQWDVPTTNRFNAWADLKIQQSAAKGVIDQGEAYDPTKDPLWSAYEPLLMARDEATKRSLKTALDLKINAINQQSADVKANYDFQIAEIQNALNMANWATGQQLAASGVIMMGHLSQALQANEAEGINKIWLSVQERTNGVNKLSEDITILRQDYADQGTLLDKITLAEVATKRLELLQGNSKEVQVAKLAIAGMKAKLAALNVAAPATAAAETAAIVSTTAEKNMQVAAWTAELAQNGITIKQNTDGTWDWEAGLSMQQKEDRNQYLFDQWYKVEGLKLDQASLTATVAFNQFQEWATREGIKLDWAQFDWQKTTDQYAMDHPSGGTGDTGGTGTGGESTTPYMEDKGGFTADMNIVNNPNEVGTNNYQQAVLRVGLGSGGLLSSNEAFLLALNGVPKQNPNLAGIIARALGKTLNLAGGMAGVLGSADEATIARLADIADEKSPSRALELYVAWKIKHPPTGATAITGSALTAAIVSYCKDFGTQLGYSAADITTATTWLTANISKLTGGTP